MKKCFLCILYLYSDVFRMLQSLTTHWYVTRNDETEINVLF